MPALTDVDEFAALLGVGRRKPYTKPDWLDEALAELAGTGRAAP